MIAELAEAFDGELKIAVERGDGNSRWFTSYDAVKRLSSASVQASGVAMSLPPKNDELVRGVTGVQALVQSRSGEGPNERPLREKTGTSDRWTSEFVLCDQRMYYRMAALTACTYLPQGAALHAELLVRGGHLYGERLFTRWMREGLGFVSASVNGTSLIQDRRLTATTIPGHPFSFQFCSSQLAGRQLSLSVDRLKSIRRRGVV